MNPVPQTIGERIEAEGARKAWADLSDDSMDSDAPPPRVCWADLADSSAEDLSASVPAGLLNNDSYIETPEPSFDNPHGSVLCNWKAATSLNPVLAAAPAQSGITQLNQKSVRIPISIEPARDQVPPASNPLREIQNTTTTSDMAARTQPSTTVLFKDRCRQKRRMLQTGGRSAQQDNKRSRQAQQLEFEPEPVVVTEEDWQRRNQKRKNVIESIKSTPEYERMSESRRRSLAGIPAPSTPDPDDRSISKRKWESLVIQWRGGVKQFTQPVGDA